MTKKLIFLIISILILFSACSKESKFGIEELCLRTNEAFSTNYDSKNFFMGKNQTDTFLFCEYENNLISVFKNEQNLITGISVLFTSEQDINSGIECFFRLCCTFTGNDISTQQAIFDNHNITSDKIKFTDNNYAVTVGKYKYTVICNELSVTLFCEKV